MLESDLCSTFLNAVDDRHWLKYPETSGFDILLSRKSDGFQIGIQAKLKFNLKLLYQIIEDRYDCTGPNPDCRAILVPYTKYKLDFEKITAYLGITIIKMRVQDTRAIHNIFYPELPLLGDREFNERQWYESAPSQRCILPDYVPDVAAGAPAPLQLTYWKTNALRLEAILKIRGHLTRQDFKKYKVDIRRWISPGTQWLDIKDGKFYPGKRFPNFKNQHPVVFKEVVRDIKKSLRFELQE